MKNVAAALGPLVYPSRSDFIVFKAMQVQPLSSVVFKTKVPLYYKFKMLLLTQKTKRCL